MFIFLSSSDREVDFDDGHVLSRISTYLSQCSDILVEEYISRALITGGYGHYPFNIIRTEQNPHVLSYSAEGVLQGIPDSNTGATFLSQELEEIYSCLIPLLETEKETYGSEVILYDLKNQVSLEQEVILVQYEYIYYYEGEVIYNNQITKTYNTNLGTFLDQTNDLTNIMLDERNPDLMFNYQFCNTILEEEGFAPKYSADFLLEMDDENIKFMFDREYFVVFLEKGEETFSFAIMPFHDGYYC